MFNIFLVLFGIVLKIIFSLFIVLKLIVKNKFNYKEEWLNTYFNNKIRVKGTINIPQDNGYIVISNHVSFEDAFFINKIFKNTKFIVANGVIAKLFYKNHNDKNLFFDTITVDAMKKWRVVHLPIAFTLGILSLLHIITVIIFSK